MPSADTHRTLRLVAWCLATVLVLWWTLLPFRHDLSVAALSRAVADIQWVPFRERGRLPLGSDLAGNLALFAPFGFAGWRCLDGRRGRLAWVLGLAGLLSLGVEVAQLTVPARRTSATDLVTDCLGAAGGAGLGRLWEARVREPAWAWLRDLAAGAAPPLLASVYGVCLAVWAVLPGAGAAAGPWTQTQIFSSSFRRFPGWQPWAAASVFPFVLGALFGALACLSGRSARPSRVGSATSAAAVTGVVCEALQLAAPTRRPEIFQALAFAVGGLAGAAAALGGRRTVLAAAATAAVVAFAATPAGDNPAGPTRAAALLGAGLVGIAVFQSSPGKR